MRRLTTVEVHSIGSDDAAVDGTGGEN